MKIKSGFAMRNIAGSNIVVPVGDKIKEFNGMITLNDSGGFLWRCFQNDITAETAAKMLSDEYEVSAEQAQIDVEKFVKIVEDNNLAE